MEPIHVLYGMLALSICVNFWAILWGCKANIAKAVNNAITASQPRNMGTPADVAMKLVERMNRVEQSPVGQYALNKIKRRFPGVIETDEQARTLLLEAVKRAKKMRADQEQKKAV